MPEYFSLQMIKYININKYSFIVNQNPLPQIPIMAIHDAFIRIAAKDIVAPIIQRQGKGQEGHLLKK